MCSQEYDENVISINNVCSMIQFSGVQSIDFLNNFVISDLADFSREKFHYTALCNPKGRIVASFWINIIKDNEISLICSKNITETLSHFFTTRLFRLKIKITINNQAILIDQSNNLIKICHTNLKSAREATINEFYLFIFKLELPWIDIKNSEKFIPQHVSLDLHENIMSFKKGCYPGQEIIARLKYLGKIKKRMVLNSHTSKSKLLKKHNNHEAVSPIIKDETKNLFLQQVIEKT